MRIRTIATAAAAAVSAPIVGVLVAQARRRKAESSAISLPAEKLTWEPIPEAPPGAQVCQLWGKPSGRNANFTKFEPYFSAPLHTHSHHQRLVVISGAFLYTREGQATQRMGAGSYFEIPANAPHATAADPTEGCLFYSENAGPFDLILVEAPAAMAH